MTQDEQNQLDIERMTRKRAEALRLLDDFKNWYMEKPIGTGNQLLYLGLMRDIMRGTEKTVDQLIKSLTEKNHQALMRKLETTS